MMFQFSFEEGPFMKYFNSSFQSMIEQKMESEAFGVETTQHHQSSQIGDPGS